MSRCSRSGRQRAKTNPVDIRARVGRLELYTGRCAAHARVLPCRETACLLWRHGRSAPRSHACASRSCLQSQSALLEDLRPACPRGPAAFVSSCACYLSQSFLSRSARIETLHHKNNCISEKLPSFSIGFAKSPQISACLNITRLHQPKTQPKTYEKLEKLTKT